MEYPTERIRRYFVCVVFCCFVLVLTYSIIPQFSSKFFISQLSRIDTSPVHRFEQRDDTSGAVDTVAVDPVNRPQGGNALPNFLLRGRREGLTWRDYHDGIVVFLHQNKAAGTSIKTCLHRMIRGGILKSPKLFKLMSNEAISETTPEEILRYEVFEGGYSFWLCELFTDKRCSYFTFLRDPIDRVLSAWSYCKTNPHDQLCGPLSVGNFTINEWAIYQGNYFFHQLLMDRGYCVDNPRIRQLFKDGPREDFIPSGTGKYIHYNETHQCWFKQRVYLDSVLSQADGDQLIKIILKSLESWFSVIGLTDEFDLSLEMLQLTYHLPFFDLCRGRILNNKESSSTSAKIKINERQKLREALGSDREVQEALRYDLMIYAKGKRIFERQRKMFLNNRKILTDVHHNAEKRKRKGQRH